MGKHMLAESGIRLKVILREERYESGAMMEEQLVVGTPGKVWTLVNMRVLGTDKLKIFVLDEADEMLMLGGLGDTTKRIRQRLPKAVQTLFFSATWTEPVKKFAKQMSAVSGREWSQIEVQRAFIFNDQVRQMYYRAAGTREKEQRLAEILNVVTVGQCIIFVHTREAVERVAAMLEQNGRDSAEIEPRWPRRGRGKEEARMRCGRDVARACAAFLAFAAAWRCVPRTWCLRDSSSPRVHEEDYTARHTVSSLHGRMEEGARDKVLHDFRAGTTRFLITTNVLARGVDVPAVTLVIQFDMPTKKGGGADPETYLHRVGRTGRFGRPGCALSLIADEKEMKVLKQIEVYFSRENMVTEVPPDTDPEEFETMLKA